MKAGKVCVNCLPTVLGNCQNSSNTSTTNSYPVPTLAYQLVSLTTIFTAMDPQPTDYLQDLSPCCQCLQPFSTTPLQKKKKEPEQGYRALPRHQSTMPVQRHQSPSHSPLSGGAKMNITLMELTSVQHYLWFMMRLSHGTRKSSSFHQGKAFITELACLFEAFTMEKALEGISFKEAITIPMLLL